MMTQSHLGILYAHGEGVSKDYQVAGGIARRLNRGGARAQYNLGWMYWKGLGVSQDAQEAAKWYRKAAVQGDGRAQYDLGLMYVNGQGVPQGFIRAYMWSHLAAATSSGSGAIELKKLQGDVTSRITAAKIGQAQETAGAVRTRS